jgi:hypothetical protein
MSTVEELLARPLSGAERPALERPAAPVACWPTNPRKRRTAAASGSSVFNTKLGEQVEGTSESTERAEVPRRELFDARWPVDARKMIAPTATRPELRLWTDRIAI